MLHFAARFKHTECRLRETALVAIEPAESELQYDTQLRKNRVEQHSQNSCSLKKIGKKSEVFFRKIEI